MINRAQPRSVRSIRCWKCATDLKFDAAKWLEPKTYVAMALKGSKRKRYLQYCPVCDPEGRKRFDAACKASDRDVRRYRMAGHSARLAVRFLSQVAINRCQLCNAEAGKTYTEDGEGNKLREPEGPINIGVYRRTEERRGRELYRDMVALCDKCLEIVQPRLSMYGKPPQPIEKEK